MTRIRAAAYAAVVSLIPFASVNAAQQQPDPQQPAQQQPDRAAPGAPAGEARTPAGEARTAAAREGGARLSVEQATADWPAGPKKALKMMTDKYGPPDGVGPTRVTWTNKDQWREIILINQEIQHDFPVPHKDYLEHVIACKVPAEKVGELAKYDGSVIVDRTRGTLSARCDTEPHNILALNLAKKIIDGSLDVEAARMQYAQAAMQEKKTGKPPEIMASLQFQPEQPGTTGDPDMATAAKPGEAGEAQPAAAKEPAAKPQPAQQEQQPPQAQEQPKQQQPRNE